MEYSCKEYSQPKILQTSVYNSKIENLDYLSRTSSWKVSRPTLGNPFILLKFFVIDRESNYVYNFTTKKPPCLSVSLVWLWISFVFFFCVHMYSLFVSNFFSMILKYLQTIPVIIRLFKIYIFFNQLKDPFISNDFNWSHTYLLICLVISICFITFNSFLINYYGEGSFLSLYDLGPWKCSLKIIRKYLVYRGYYKFNKV